MAEIEIGRGKSARRGVGLDEIGIVPTRRTRDVTDTDISWSIDAYRFELPFLGAPMDGIASPDTSVALDALGGLGVLHLEGLWGRVDDPAPVLAEFAEIEATPEGAAKVAARVRELSTNPVRPELIRDRVADMRARGATVAVAVSPRRVEGLLSAVLAAEPDLLVIMGTVVSAEVDGHPEALNLKQVLRRLEVPTLVGGATSYEATLHLMRTGAVGVLVGVGPGRQRSTMDVLGVGAPVATAIADARAARMRHLDETGVYCHVVAGGGLRTSGDIAKAVACGADAVMLGVPLAAATEAPAGGWNWSTGVAHPTLPRGWPKRFETLGSLESIVAGPTDRATGRTNLAGGLRKAVALCGYSNLKDFQKAELVVGEPSAWGQ